MIPFITKTMIGIRPFRPVEVRAMQDRIVETCFRKTRS
jgi:hypothetical protein